MAGSRQATLSKSLVIFLGATFIPALSLFFLYLFSPGMLHRLTLARVVKYARGLPPLTRRRRCDLVSRMYTDPAFDATVKWTREISATNESSWRLQIEGCALDIDVERARRCFKEAMSRGMIMIGDSLTRYQYLNLVYFLRTGEWKGPRPSNANENEFG